MQPRSEPFDATMTVRPSLRRLALLFAAATLAGLSHSAFDADFAMAPDFVLKSAGGANHRLSEYRSEVVVIAFWPRRCGDCGAQRSLLERIQREFGASDLRVLAVTRDEKAHMAASDEAFPLLLDATGEVAQLYDVGKLPRIVVVDRAGRMHASYEGETSEQVLQREVRMALAE